jgi:hypothetical protein
MNEPKKKPHDPEPEARMSEPKPNLYLFLFVGVIGGMLALGALRLLRLDPTSGPSALFATVVVVVIAGVTTGVGVGAILYVMDRRKR